MRWMVIFTFAVGIQNEEVATLRYLHPYTGFGIFLDRKKCQFIDTCFKLSVSTGVRVKKVLLTAKGGRFLTKKPTAFLQVS